MSALPTCLVPPSATAARVDMVIANNDTWQDAFQFGDADDTSWSFTGVTFRLDLKASVDDAAALLSLTSGGGTIVVTDEALRILHMLVPEATIQADLPVAEYIYDLVMIDGAIRTTLMYGTVTVTQGITGG